MSRENIYISGVTVKQCKTTSCSCFRAEHQWSREDWTYLIKRHILCRLCLAFFAVQRRYWQIQVGVCPSMQALRLPSFSLLWVVIRMCGVLYMRSGSYVRNCGLCPVCCFISYNACLRCAEEKEGSCVCTFVSKAGLYVCAVLLH